MRLRITLALGLCAGSAFAGEFAVLTTGARLRAERHEVSGSKIRLFTTTGTTELPASMVTGFELEEQFSAAPDAVAKPAPAAGTNTALNSRELVEQAAREQGLPPELLRSVVAAESGYRAKAVSPKGAIGLMQLMPATARELGVNPHDPAQNVAAGARYLADLLRKYNGGLWHALAAYNAGPGAVEKYNGIPPYRETRAYINRINRTWLAATGNKSAGTD